jgi:hypothetical protein
MAKTKKVCEFVQPVIHGFLGNVILGIGGGEGLELNVILISFTMMMPSMP